MLEAQNAKASAELAAAQAELDDKQKELDEVNAIFNEAMNKKQVIKSVFSIFPFIFCNIQQ